MSEEGSFDAHVYAIGSQEKSLLIKVTIKG